MNRRLFFFCILLYSFTIISCGTGSKDNCVYRVSCESLYDYDSEHDDTLLVGMSGINKETFMYGDGTISVRLKMYLFDYDSYNEKVVYRAIVVPEEKFSELEAFLDSCLMKPLVNDGERWEVSVGNGVTLSYQRYHCSVMACFSPESLADLRITPKRLKEILVRAKMTD